MCAGVCDVQEHMLVAQMGVTMGKLTLNADRKCLVLQWKRMLELPHSWKAETLGVGSVCHCVFLLSHSTRNT